MGILASGLIPVSNGEVVKDNLEKALDKIKNNDEIYKFILFESTTKNPTVPAFKYIVAYMIPTIVESLKKRGFQINEDSLYRLFERKFTPLIKDDIMGDYVEYYNMKALKTKELSDVAFKIKKWAEQYNIEFVERSETKEPEFTDSLAEAIANQTKDLKTYTKL